MRDLSKFVDRKDQLARFDQLLKFEDDARILVIQDETGMGKTYFLEKLHSYCRKVQPRIPVVFVDLQELPDKSSFSLLKEMWDDLKNTDVVFPKFEAFYTLLVNEAHVVNNFSINTFVQDNKFENIDHVNILPVISKMEDELRTQAGNELIPKQVKRDERTGEQAFLDDLRDYCQNKPVVLLFDHYERCNDEKLKKWITEYFLDQYFFNIKDRPKNLLLVIAGSKEGLPRFIDNWPDVICENVINWFEKLGPWPVNELEHFIKLCRASIAPSEIEQIHGLMQSGMLDIKTLSVLVEIRAGRTIR